MIHMTKRYTQQGEYYIKDNTLNKKISYRDTVNILNHQERIIQSKTELINKLTGTIQAYENNVEVLEKDKEYYKTLLEKLIG